MSEYVAIVGSRNYHERDRREPQNAWYECPYRLAAFRLHTMTPENNPVYIPNAKIRCEWAARHVRFVVEVEDGEMLIFSGDKSRAKVIEFVQRRSGNE